MKKIIPFLLLFFLFCTSCSNIDDNNTTYTKITDKEKELVVGDWQLIQVNTSDVNRINFVRQGVEVFYSFDAKGKLTIQNTTSDDIVYLSENPFLTTTNTMHYTFDYLKEQDVNQSKKEQIQLYDEKEKESFVLQVTEEELILTQSDGTKAIFIRSEFGPYYPKLSKEEKEGVVGTWRLTHITAFTAQKRDFGIEEEVRYHFKPNHTVEIQNVSASENGVFDSFVKSRTCSTLYRYDPFWEKREVLDIQGLGSFSIRLDQEGMAFAQYDGYFVIFERIK